MTEQERAAAIADEIAKEYAVGWSGPMPGSFVAMIREIAEKTALRAYARPAPADLREAIARAVDPVAWDGSEPIPTRDAIVSWHERRQKSVAVADRVLSLLPQTQEGDYFGELVERARTAAAKAALKFPQPNYIALKIAEEAGEVVRGAVHYAEKRMEWPEVEGEIVQLLAMLIRFVTEGDGVIGAIPRLDRATDKED